MLSTKAKNLSVFAAYSAIFIWGILAYAFIFHLLLKGNLLACVIADRPYVSDFANIYNAAHLAKQCLLKSINIYDFEIQNHSLSFLIKPVVPEQPFYLQYPPLFFILCLPLSFLSIQLAWLIWTLSGFVLCTYSIKVLCFELGYSTKATFIIIGLILSSYPAWLSVKLGQTSLFLTSFVIWLFICLCKNRYYLAGLLNILVSLKLQYMPMFTLLGLFKGGYSFIFSYALNLLIVTFLSLIFLSTDNILNYPNALMNGETGKLVSGVSAHLMQNLRGELIAIFKNNSHLINILSIIFWLSSWLIVSLFNIISKKQNYRNNEKKFFVLTSYTIILALAFSPHTHCQDYLLTSISCLLLFNCFLFSNTKDDLAIKYLKYLLLAYSPLSWLFYFFEPLFFSCGIQPFFAYNLLILLLSLKIYFLLLTDKINTQAQVGK